MKIEKEKEGGGFVSGTFRKQSSLANLIESAIDDCIDDGERGHAAMNDFNGKTEVFTRFEKSGKGEDPLVIVSIVENGNTKFTYAEYMVKYPVS